MAIELSTNYLGLTLSTPLVASASPLTANLQALQRLEQCGASAAVLPSLFAEQIEYHDRRVSSDPKASPARARASGSYISEIELYNAGRDDYLQHLICAKKILKMPIIPSLNCRGPGRWIREARRFETAGADALELNIYDVTTDPDLTGSQVEDQQLRIVDSIRRDVTLPLAVKIGPFYSSLPNFSRRLLDAGADGIVLFNRYLEPELDLNEMDVQPHLELSHPNEIRLPLRWIAILRDAVPISLGASSGVDSASDALKLLLAGANVVMLTSSLLRNGTEHIESMLAAMKQWMEDHHHDSIRQLQGVMSHKNCPDPSGYDRANYVRAIVSYLP